MQVIPWRSAAKIRSSLQTRVGLSRLAARHPDSHSHFLSSNSMETKFGGKGYGSCWCDQGYGQKPAPPHGPHGLQGSPCLGAWGSILPHPLQELAGLCHTLSLALCAVFCPFSSTFPQGCCLSPALSSCTAGLTSPRCAPSRAVRTWTHTWYTNYGKKTPKHFMRQNTTTLFNFRD